MRLILKPTVAIKWGYELINAFFSFPLADNTDERARICARHSVYSSLLLSLLLLFPFLRSFFFLSRPYFRAFFLASLLLLSFFSFALSTPSKLSHRLSIFANTPGYDRYVKGTRYSVSTLIDVRGRREELASSLRYRAVTRSRENESARGGNPEFGRDLVRGYITRLPVGLRIESESDP